jgi:biopolymer transport protein ExbB
MKLLFPIFGFLASATALQAQSNPGDDSTNEIVLSELLSRGGVMMYPLAALALIALILIILYFLTIRRRTVVTNRFMNNADGLIRKRDFMGLLGYSQRRSEMVARLTRKTLQFITDNPNASATEIREIAETEGSRQSNALAQRINWLADIGAIAPMVGLLGTVIGMIKSFMQISKGEVGVLQQMLAAGVSEALVTTATGLVIGITAMVFHSFFKGRVNRFLSEFEAASTHIITLITAQISAQQAVPTAPPGSQFAPQMPTPGQPGTDLHPTHQVVYPQSPQS